MKIIHKTEIGEILSEAQLDDGGNNDISENQVQELKNQFDDKTIIRLEVEFEEGIKCGQVHDFRRVAPEMLKSLTAILKND